MIQRRRRLLRAVFLEGLGLSKPSDGVTASHLATLFALRDGAERELSRGYTRVRQVLSGLRRVLAFLHEEAEAQGAAGPWKQELRTATGRCWHWARHGASTAVVSREGEAACDAAEAAGIPTDLVRRERVGLAYHVRWYGAFHSRAVAADDIRVWCERAIAVALSRPEPTLEDLLEGMAETPATLEEEVRVKELVVRSLLWIREGEDATRRKAMEGEPFSSLYRKMQVLDKGAWGGEKTYENRLRALLGPGFPDGTAPLGMRMEPFFELAERWQVEYRFPPAPASG